MSDTNGVPYIDKLVRITSYYFFLVAKAYIRLVDLLLIFIGLNIQRDSRIYFLSDRCVWSRIKKQHQDLLLICTSAEESEKKITTNYWNCAKLQFNSPWEKQNTKLVSYLLSRKIYRVAQSHRRSFKSSNSIYLQ